MYLLLEETEKQAVRKALIEERGRFCTFITFLQPVVVSAGGLWGRGGGGVCWCPTDADGPPLSGRRTGSSPCWGRSPTCRASLRTWWCSPPSPTSCPPPASRSVGKKLGEGGGSEGQGSIFGGGVKPHPSCR